MTYHNTTHSTGEELRDFRRKTLAQDHLVLEFFKKHPNETFTPSQVLHRLFAENVPVTSVRRAMTNLTDRGKLEKTTEQRKGPFGRPEYCWRLPGGQLDMF